jgi:hypothetical protein
MVARLYLARSFSSVRAEPFDFAVPVRLERNAVKSKENGYAQDKLREVESKHERRIDD